MGFYVRVEPDVKIYVEDLNPKGKKAILFLHGWPGSHKLFEYQFNALPQLGYRCIGIDTRGFGDSDKPYSGYGYDRLSDDLRSVIEALKLNEATLLGHSTGGSIAVRYMSRHNEYGISKLVLCAAAVPSLIIRQNFPYGLPNDAVNSIIEETYRDRPKMLREFSNMFFYKLTTEALSDWFFQLGLEAAGWATASIAKTWLGEEELFSDMGKISVPTLILHGIHDKVCLFPLAEAQNKGIKNSRLVAFQESGHGLFYDEHDKFNKELMQFIEE
ncbi:arylesterase [Oxobacter pfennigii]|uniref:Arylesterase n=1 Tax=Oxobacter pfennigii TaxID=36849 RepID=A0A0P8W1Q9_9CLOT|nr:alpha/beta hydrolase [Oxobacter pfennigii]KPU42406.1 arylesterase [Oxobacter pfennigii]